MSATAPKLPAPRLLADTMLGKIVVSDGIVYFLTKCCEASHKGSTNSPSGVICRGCYAPLYGPHVGAGWAATDPAAVPALARLLRPYCGDFADGTAEAIMESAQRG